MMGSGGGRGGVGVGGGRGRGGEGRKKWIRIWLQEEYTGRGRVGNDAQVGKTA